VPTNGMPRNPNQSPDAKDLQRLRQSCRATLERYVDLAFQTSGHLTRLTPGSVDRIGRANLVLLSQKEEQALKVYLRARSVLLQCVIGENATSDHPAEGVGRQDQGDRQASASSPA
jgi:hypothetical protein